MFVLFVMGERIHRLPVVGCLSAIVPGVRRNSLFKALSVGSGMCGNGSSIGASANVVTVGIAEGGGYCISHRVS